MRALRLGDEEHEEGRAEIAVPEPSAAPYTPPFNREGMEKLATLIAAQIAMRTAGDAKRAAEQAEITARQAVEAAEDDFNNWLRTQMTDAGYNPGRPF